MKTALLRMTVIGVVVAFIVAVITSVVVGFGLVIAYALTLIIKNLEMPQALTSGAVFSVVSLYFCFKFLTHSIDARNSSHLCDECSENDESQDEQSTPFQQPFVLRTTRTKKPKTRQAHNK